MVLDETKKEVLVDVQIGIILGILFFYGIFGVFGSVRLYIAIVGFGFTLSLCM